MDGQGICEGYICCAAVVGWGGDGSVSGVMKSWLLRMNANSYKSGRAAHQPFAQSVDEADAGTRNCKYWRGCEFYYLNEEGLYAFHAIPQLKAIASSDR